MDEKGPPLKQSLLPYEAWAAEALRGVAVRALAYAAVHGLPGGHHFYLTFRTGAPGVGMPAPLRKQFPEEMTIVLQHQFWDLAVDEAAGRFSVGLSFGGVPSKLTIPFAALVSFVDPEVQLGLRFVPPEPNKNEKAAPNEVAAPETPAEAAAPAAEAKPEVVSLDAFRRRSNKE